MIFLIGIIVLFIVLIVGIVFSAKKTHWMNLVGAFFVFGTAVFYMMMIGMVKETRKNWLEVYQNNKAKFEKLEKEYNEVVTGSSSDFERPLSSLKGYEMLARQQVFGKGRVWRQCSPEAFIPGANASALNTGSVIVNLPENSPAFKAEVDPAVAGTQNADGTSLVYVFKEVADATVPGGYRLENYIGSFFATEPADDNSTVKLTPSLILPDPSNFDQLKATNANYKSARELVTEARDANTFWAMYDILPTDSYTVFEDAIRAEKGDPELEVTVDMLREELTTRYLPPAAMRMDAQSPEYERIIDSIVYTDEIEAVYKDDTEFTPADDEIWYEIKFEEKPKGTFQVDFNADDDAQKQIALKGQAFDGEGLALVGTLKLGSEVQFEKDQTVILDNESWNKNPVDFLANMKADRKAVESRVFYRRKLNDFDFTFRSLVAANTQLTSDRAHAAEKLAQLQEIDKVYESQKKIRENRSAKLNKDVTNFKKDDAAMVAYRTELETRLKTNRDEVDRYFRLTKELLAKKAKMEAELKEKIDENTRKAAAAAGDAQ